MLIEEQIRRIKENIARAYQALLNKGATLPDKQNSNNLSATIETVTSGPEKKYNITMDCILPDAIDGSVYTPEAQNLIMNGVETIYIYALADKFSGSASLGTRDRGLSSATFPDLINVDNYGMYHFCTYSLDLEYVSFPKLEEVSSSGMEEAFYCNNGLKTATFPKLKTIYNNGMKFALADCYNLESVNFDSLEMIHSAALQYAFRNTKITSLVFPKLKAESFSYNKNQLDGMLYGVTGCTVRFPYHLKKVIGNLSSVTEGFGGTDTVVLFDLLYATINFTVNSENAEIYVDDEKIVEMTQMVGLNGGEFYCYDQSLNTVYFGNYPVLEDKQSIDVDINLNTNTRQVSLTTGVSGLDVVFEINGLKFNAQEIENGKYGIKTIGTDAEITYYVNGGNTYSDETGTLSPPSNSNSYNMTITMREATWVAFTRPNLTEDGVVGGDSFAVESSNASTSYYAAYKVMDGDPDDGSWWYSGNDDEPFITFYNPKQLKVSEISITFESNSTSYAADTITILGSNDNQNWTELASSPYENVVTRTINVGSEIGYKYHKIVMPVYSMWLSIEDVSFVATCKT